MAKSMTSSSVLQIGLYSKHYYTFKQLGIRGCYIVNVVTAMGHMTDTEECQQLLHLRKYSH